MMNTTLHTRMIEPTFFEAREDTLVAWLGMAAPHASLPPAGRELRREGADRLPLRNVRSPARHVRNLRSGRRLAVPGGSVGRLPPPQSRRTAAPPAVASGWLAGWATGAWHSISREQPRWYRA